MKTKSKIVSFPSRDGLELHGTFTLPGKAAKGSMLLVHGITSDRSEWGIFDRVADHLAVNGIASLRFDYRGHGKSELKESQISLAGIVSDILSAWQILEERVEATDKHFKRYIMGSSFGGGVAYEAAGRVGGIEHLFLLAPVFDYFVDIEHCAPKWRADLKSKGYLRYNDLRLGRPLLNEALYFNPLKGPRTPTTIYHGTADTDVDIQLSKAVSSENPNIKLLPIKGAGHVLAVPEDFDMEDEVSWKYVGTMIDHVLKMIA